MVLEARRDQPDQVEEPHREDANATFASSSAFFFRLRDSSSAERQAEVAERPAAARRSLQAPWMPLEVARDFFRQVAGPDDQELREREVGPQHHEARASACRSRGSAATVSTTRIGSRGASSASTAIDERERRQPLADDHESRPKMVEYQCGSSDMTQSTAAKLIVRDKTSSPGAADHAEPARVGLGDARFAAILRRRPLVQQQRAEPSRRRSRPPRGR